MVNLEVSAVTVFKRFVTRIPNMDCFPCPRRSPLRSNRGITLIELLVTLAVVAVLATLAAPSFRDFIVRGKMTSVTGDFTSSVMRARNAAVSHNICTVMCMSSKAGDAAPECTTAGEDWQKGWIVFLNPSCDSSVKKPDAKDVILARVASDSIILLNTQDSVKSMQFSARGIPSAKGRFDLVYGEVNNPMTDRFGTNICVDMMGRSRVIPGNKTCTNY